MVLPFPYASHPFHHPPINHLTSSRVRRSSSSLCPALVTSHLVSWPAGSLKIHPSCCHQSELAEVQTCSDALCKILYGSPSLEGEEPWRDSPMQPPPPAPTCSQFLHRMHSLLSLELSPASLWLVYSLAQPRKSSSGTLVS